MQSRYYLTGQSQKEASVGLVNATLGSILELARLQDGIDPDTITLSIGGF